MKLTLLCIIFFTAVSGCAYQALATYEKPDGRSMVTAGQETQPKIASVAHWKMIAENEAKLLKQRFDHKPINIQQDNSSNFSTAFFNLLTSSLVSNQAVVIINNNSPSAVNVSYKLNIATNAPGNRPHDTEISTWEGEVAYYYSEAAAEVIKAPIQIIKDQFVKNLSTATELIVTTQAIQGSQLLYSASNVYYIETNNIGNYQSYLPPQINIPTPPRFTAGKAVSMKVVGDGS